MSPMKPRRAALYLRVSTFDQDTENQRRALREEAERRGWIIVQEYEDVGISGAKGREQRPAFDAAMADAARRRFDVLMVAALDRMGRCVVDVANALRDLDLAGVHLFSMREGADGTTPMGRALLHMASVFAELERGIIADRIRAGVAKAKAKGVHCGRPRIPAEVEAEARELLASGRGILATAKALGLGSGTVQRIRQEMRAGG